MPRYELVEGKSKKFWEIQLHGTSFTTTFGRIGTNGQSKTKDFADDAAAKKAHDKLVQQKVGKGYVLVGESESAPTPAAPTETAAPQPAPEAARGPEPDPAPTPAEAAPTEAADPTRLGRVTWPSALDAHLPDPAAAKPLELPDEDPATLYARINDWARPAIKPAIEQGIAVYPNYADRAKKVVWSYFAPRMPETLDPRVEADAFLLFTAAPGTPTQDIAWTLVRFWNAHSGLAFALETWLKTLEPLAVSGYGFGRDSITPRLALVYDDVKGVKPYVRPDQRIQRFAAPRLLRHLLDEAEPEAAAEARARAEAMREGAEAVVRIGLDEVFRDATWLRDDVAAFGGEDSIFSWAPQFLLGALEPEEVADIFAKLEVEECLRLARSGALLELLHRHRVRAIPAVAAWIRRTATHLEGMTNFWSLGGTLKETLQQVGRCVEDSPPIAAALVEVVAALDKKKLSKHEDPTPVAIELLRAMPEAALPALQARRNAQWVKRILPQLERLAGAEERADEASVDELPEELRTEKGFAKAPDFWAPDALPQILLHGGRALPAAAVDALGQALAKGHRPTIEAVKAACTPASLARFAWELFVVWDTAGGPSKHKWAMEALGHFGDDESARRLTPFIRRWPGESQHKRAVNALDVLSAIGSDTAMMCLNGIAQKVKYKGLQKNARLKMDEIAERRGLTKEELEDRLVPDLGLEDDGSMELDFGPRSFRVGFDETLTPFVVDASGKKRKSLPKPGVKDDEALASEAVARFKGMKKDVRTLAKIELARLERAMGRRDWAVADFEAFLVHHPLMIHVVRRLVWGEVDEAGRPTRTFRVAEDRTYADIDDEEISLGDDVKIGLVHRLHLSDDEVARWREVFRDYELEPPFAQLDRDVYALEPGDAEGAFIVKFDKREVETAKLMGLQSRGWHHGTPQDAGAYHMFGKPVRGGLHAWLHFESGIVIGGWDYSDPTQLLGPIEFSEDEPWSWGRQAGPNSVPVGDIDEVTISEVLRDVASLPEVRRE